MKERFLDCCIGLLTGDSGADNPDFLYVQILSRGGLREAISSEKMIKLKTLLKDDINIRNIMDSIVKHDENIETLLHHVGLSRCTDDMVTLSEDRREVAIYIAGYVVKT